jgi:hypothetical protein
LAYLDVRYCPKISLEGLRKLQQYLPLLHPETNQVNPVTDDIMEVDDEDDDDDEEEKYGFFFLKVRKSDDGDSDDRYSDVSDSKSQYWKEDDEDDLSSDYYVATNSSESVDSSDISENSIPSRKRRTLR